MTTLERIDAKIDSLEARINRFTNHDWKEYKGFISDEIKNLKNDIDKLDDTSKSQRDRITKLETLFENAIEAMNKNSCEISKALEKISAVEIDSKVSDEKIKGEVGGSGDNKGMVSKALDNQAVLLAVLVSLIKVIETLIKYLLGG